MGVCLQENFFFDGPNKELNSRLVVLRLRFYDTDKKAVLTLKVGLAGALSCCLPACCQHAVQCCVVSALQASPSTACICCPAHCNPGHECSGCVPSCAVCCVWLQGKQILQDGIGRATEIEEELDAADARRFLQQPSELLKLPSELMQNLAR